MIRLVCSFIVLLAFLPTTGCVYLTDRARDFADIFHGEFHLGFGIHANAQITRFTSGGLGFRATDAYGFIGRRAGTWEVHWFDCSVPVPYFGSRIGLGWSERDRKTGTVEQAPPDFFSDRISDFHPLADPNRRLGDVGGGFNALFCGLDVYISLFELADFFIGLAGLDIMDDDDAWLLRDFNSDDDCTRLNAYRKFFSRGEGSGESWTPTEYEKARLDAAGLSWPEKLIEKMLNDPDDRIVRLCAEIMPIPDKFNFLTFANRLGHNMPGRWALHELERMLAQNKGRTANAEIDEIIGLLGPELPPEPFVRYKYPGAVKYLSAGMKTKKTREELAPYLEALNFHRDPSAVPELVSLLGSAEQSAKPDILFSLLKHEAYGYGDVYSKYVKERNNIDAVSWYAIELLVRGGDGVTLNRVRNAAETRGTWLGQKIARVIFHRKDISVEKLLPYRTDK